MPRSRIAVVQAAPVYMNCAATTSKACDLIAEAGRNGARLVVLPEAFIPTYPNWIWSIAPSQNQELSALYAELLDQSVAIPDAFTDQLCHAARRAGVYVVIGVNERNTEASNASLYNTLLYIDDQGSVLGKHRKLVPTAPERMVWAQGDGSTLEAYDTPLGRLGGLTCWENYMPLARYALYAWGVQLYIAPTFDEGEPWLSTLRHIAKEGGVYVAGCCMVLRTEDVPDRFVFKKALDPEQWISEGDSVIVGPDGNLLTEPLNKAEGILYAEVDLAKLQGLKWKFDVAGHYARPDVFQLSLDRGDRPMLKVEEKAAGVPDAQADETDESVSTTA